YIVVLTLISGYLINRVSYFFLRFPDIREIRMSNYENRWSTVHVAVENKIGWVTLNRPEKRNAMSPTLNREMAEVLDELELDDDVGVVVLTGAGEAWTAGMDLKEYFRETDGKSDVYQERIRRECSR